MQIGVIGPGNQAAKIARAMIRARPGLSFTIFAHRQGITPAGWLAGGACGSTTRFGDLLSCPILVIASPNHEHAGHLRQALEAGYAGYIFLEKPPAQRGADLDWMANLDDSVKKKVYINFNYRHSLYYKGLAEDGKRFSLGGLLSVNVITSHGLGLKPGYGGTWRASRQKHAGGVFETVAIHFLDMLIKLCGEPVSAELFMSSRSPYGDAPDNCLLACGFHGGVALSVTVSYTAPFMSSVTALYENGVVTYADEKIVRAPRETFDSEGLFAPPPVVYGEAVDRKNAAAESLFRSVEWFLSKAEGQREFDPAEYDMAIATGRTAAKLIEAKL